MAGTPKKRERREKAAATAGAGLLPPAPPPVEPLPPNPFVVIPDARRRENGETSYQPRARARTHASAARTPVTSTTRAPTLGTATRAAIDDRVAASVRSLASAFKPGMRLRLSRLRPTWAGGYLEDYPITVGESLASYYEHIKDEYGGQSYMVEVLGAGDVQVFEGAVTIAGPPKEYGKVINRAKWEGRDDDDAPRARNAGDVDRAPRARDDGSSMMAFVKMFVDMQQATNASQLATVKELVTETRQQTQSVLQTLVTTREQQEHKTSFATQLAEIVDATTALDRVKKVIAGPQQRAQRNGPAPDDDDTALIAQAAKKAFFESVAGSLVKRPAAAAAPAPRPMPRPERPPQPAGFIPDARSPRQATPKN